MYLFTRTARITQGGRVGDKLTYAVELTGLVSAVAETPIGLHATTLSAGLGTVVWSIFAEDLAALETAGDRMAADEGVQEFMATRGDGVFAEGMDDQLWQIVHGAADPQAPNEYVSVFATSCSPGTLARGAGLGVEIAEKAEAACGYPTMFAMSVTGQLGAVCWLTGYPDIRALQDGETAVMGDPAMLDIIDGEAATVYTNDAQVSGTTYYRRIV